MQVRLPGGIIRKPLLAELHRQIGQLRTLPEPAVVQLQTPFAGANGPALAGIGIDIRSAVQRSQPVRASGPPVGVLLDLIHGRRPGADHHRGLTCRCGHSTDLQSARRASECSAPDLERQGNPVHSADLPFSVCLCHSEATSSTVCGQSVFGVECRSNADRELQANSAVHSGRRTKVSTGLRRLAVFPVPDIDADRNATRRTDASALSGGYRDRV